mgnify:CR=1 FL=1|tara:strand:+ start:509 stop:700 length:192 start_codon:yes stop_codon:yes gene_type:complete
MKYGVSLVLSSEIAFFINVTNQITDFFKGLSFFVTDFNFGFSVYRGQNIGGVKGVLRLPGLRI